MARSTPPDAAEGARELPGERLQWAGVPWLEAPRARLGAARREGRVAHALLLHGTEGAGQSALAAWAAQLLLCERPDDGPCGRCASCVLFLAGNHPDFHSIRIEEKASFIKVDQIRELCTTLSLRSYRGGRKVGVIDPADRMNMNASNALLKTLEEPSEDTILILVASRIDRLARTVVSRCQRVRVVPPATADALAWLATRETRGDWSSLLALAAGAPLRALELASSGVGELAQEMASRLRGLRRQMEGDNILRERNEPVPPSIVERVQGIVDDQWQSTSAPTATNADAYRIAGEEFLPVLQALRLIVEVDLRGVEMQLERAGAPWTPGRVPEWKME